MAELQKEFKSIKKRLDYHEARIEETDVKLDHLSTSVAEDREKDIYAFGDHSERQDFTSNLQRTGAVLLTGTSHYFRKL